MNNQAIDREAVEAKRLALEKKHGKAYAVIVEDKVSYHRKPRLQEIGYAMSIIQSDMFGANRSLLSSTFLDGDRDTFEDEDYLGGASMVCQEMITFKQAELLK